MRVAGGGSFLKFAERSEVTSTVNQIVEEPCLRLDKMPAELTIHLEMVLREPPLAAE